MSEGFVGQEEAVAAAVVVHHGSSRCLSGVSADFQTPKRRRWRLECRGGAKRAVQVFERSSANFFLFFFSVPV